MGSFWWKHDAIMTPENYKFGHLDAAKQDIEFQYSNCWALEKTSGPDRMVIAPRSGICCGYGAACDGDE